MALRQTVENRDQNTAFVPTGTYVDLGRYEDFVFRHDLKSSVAIEFKSNFSQTDATLFGVAMPPTTDQANLSVSLELDYLSSIDRIYLAKSTVDLGQRDVRVHKESMRGRQIGRAYRTSVDFLRDANVNLANSRNAKFHIVPPHRMGEARLTDHQRNTMRLSDYEGRRLVATQFAGLVEELVPQELATFHYIGPLREHPRRMYLSTGETPGDVGIFGELGPPVLWSASVARQLDSDRLSVWCSRMGLACRIVLSPVGEGLFQVVVIDTHTEVPVNLPDVGVGTSQILPILVQGLVASTGATLFLEQPEIHLHPKVQADLADFLLEVSQRGVGVIVETHSEHLMTRLQRRIAEEALDPEDVALYYVTPSRDGSSLQRVVIDEFGQIPSAPEGFFEEGFEETFKFMSAVGARKAQGNRAGDSK